MTLRECYLVWKKVEIAHLIKVSLLLLSYSFANPFYQEVFRNLVEDIREPMALYDLLGSFKCVDRC